MKNQKGKAMKLQNTFITSLLILFSLQFSFGQENNKAELIDNIVGGTYNDALLASVDMFYSILTRHKASGYIIIYGTRKDPVKKYIYERKIQGCFLNGKRYGKSFELGKDVVLSFGEDRSELEIEFWKVPDNSEKPQYAEMPKDYRLPGLNKRQLIWMWNPNEDYCLLFFDSEFFSRFLKPNPHLTGEIIISEKNFELYQKVKQKYLKELTMTHKVAPRQIKFFRGKYSGDSGIEFWLVPKQNKKR
jgi:hypothetical protein